MWSGFYLFILLLFETFFHFWNT